jgi:hypothetical protein
LFKRGVVGQYHKVSIEDLEPYLYESMFRFNRRDNPDLFDLVIARMLIASVLQYAELTSGTSAQDTRRRS